MSVSFVGSDGVVANVTAAGQEMTATMPAVADGDVALLFTGWAGRVTRTDVGPLSTPAGWTYVDSTDNTRVWSRTLDGTETDVVVAYDASSANTHLHLIVFRGANLAQAASAQAIGTGGNPETASATLVDSGVFVQFLLCDDAANGALSLGAYTVAEDTYEDQGVFSTPQTAGTAYLLAAAGASGILLWVPAIAVDEDWIVHTVAVIQTGLFVGHPTVEVTSGGASVPSPNGYARLPEVLDEIEAETEPEPVYTRDVPLPTWIDSGSEFRP